MNGNLKNILVANHFLEKLGGSETFTYTLIEELVSIGYNVEYFTFRKGLISNKIEENLGVYFMSRKKYDLILANHNTCVEYLFDKGFIIQTCHGIYPKLEQPSIFADFHVSISTEVQNYLAMKSFPSYLIYNGINCNRFKNYKRINNKLTNVLSLCHSKEANDKIKKICKELDLNYFEAFKYDNPVWNLEDFINQSDLVVGIGRSAYEAMACGRPVVIWDKRNYFESVGDGYIKDMIGFSLLNNCSGRYSMKYFDNHELKMEFLKYNFNDSDYFRNFALKHLNIVSNTQEYLNVYFMFNKNKLNFKRKIYRLVKLIFNKNIIKIFLNIHKKIH